MNKGYIGLLTMLFIGAAVTAISVTVILLGLSVSRSSFSIVQSAAARGLADACTEEALQQIRDFVPFSGSGSLSMGAGSCSYTVVKGTGQNRTATASGIVGTVVRKVKVTVTRINPQMTIGSWQEVVDF
jgi:hypothetical protein